MSRWADWFLVSGAEATALIAAKKQGVEAVEELLQPWLERLEELPVHVAMDKAPANLSPVPPHGLIGGPGEVAARC
jgi:hypothetical protein